MPTKITSVTKLLPLMIVLLPGCSAQAPNNNIGTSNHAPLSKKEQKQVEVLAYESWQNSGINLTRGAKVTIRSMGRWSPWPEVGMSCGPEGDSTSSIVGEAPWIPLCALMAKLGNNGRPFLVGPFVQFTAEQPEPLFFAMNDSFNFLQNNSGALSVRVTIEYPNTPDTPPYSSKQ